MERIVFFNTKGGTGKTTLDNLMIDYLKGRNINFKDYVIKITENIDLLPSSNNIWLIDEYLTDYLINKTLREKEIYKASYRNIIIKDIFEKNIGKHDYDYVIIDSQPNFSLLSTTSIIYARKMIVLIKPALFSFLDIEYLTRIIKNLERKYGIKIKIAGIVINAFEKRKKIPEIVIDILKETYGHKFIIFDQKIRYLVHYQESILSKKEPVFKAFPGAEASTDIIELFSEIEEKVSNFN